MLVWLFKVRNRLNLLLETSKSDKTWFGAVWTLLFSVFYLQFKLNRLQGQAGQLATAFNATKPDLSGIVPANRKIMLHVVINGSAQGPMNMEQLREEMRRGNVSLASSGWTEGQVSWLPLGEIPEVVAALLPPLPNADKSTAAEIGE